MNRIIWSNIDINPEEWRDYYLECHEANEWDEDPNDEDNLWNFINDSLQTFWEDECINLATELDGRILMIADLSLCDGRKSGYRILSNNLADILSSEEGEYVEWYGDGYNIRAIDRHHDGTNYYLYRVIREDRNIDNLLSDIYEGKEISSSKLNYYTKSLYPYMFNIYGWRKQK